MGINDFVPGVSLTTVISMLLLLIKTVADNFNITDVEMSILSDSKKIIIYLSQASIFSLIYTFIIIFIMIFYDISVLSSSEWVIAFALLFIVLLLIFLLSFFLVYSFIHAVSIKVSFYINHQSEEWKIVRRVDKKKLLISKNDNNTFKFINVDEIFDGKEIVRRLSNKKVYIGRNISEKFIYNINKIKKIALVSFVVISILMILVAGFLELDPYIKTTIFMLYLLVGVFCVYTMVVENNEKIKKQFKETKVNN